MILVDESLILITAFAVTATWRFVPGAFGYYGLSFLEPLEIVVVCNSIAKEALKSSFVYD